jgi:tetratricopeptide (TPR) repeat protein
MKGANASSFTVTAPPDPGNGAHSATKKGGAVPFAPMEPRPVDAPMWPIHPTIWFQPELAPSAPAWSGLAIERRNRIPAPGFVQPDIAPWNRASALDNACGVLIPDPRPETPQNGLALLGWDPRTVLPEGERRMSSSLPESFIHAASLEIAGKKEEALAELCQARDAGYHSPKLYNAIGHLQFELRQFMAAAHTYEEVLRVDGGDAAAHYNRAVCLEKLGAWEDSAAGFQKAVELDGRRASAHLGLAISQLHLDNPREALGGFEACLERQPFREAAQRGQAVALHLLGRYQEASECYQKLLCGEPRSEELLANIISLAISHGDRELLDRYSQRLLEIRPAAPLALEGSALSAFERRDFFAAFRCCAALVEARPTYFAGWFNCGVALQKLGQTERAADAYAHAASLDPQSAEAFLSWGTVLHELERWEEARGAYERALALAPGFRTALWNLGLLCESRNELRKAEGLYFRLIEHHPDAQEAWFRLGYVRLQLGDFRASIEAFQTCVALPQKCPEALLNAGIAKWRMGEIEAAKETFRQGQGSLTTSSEALRCLAAIALQQQEYEQALTLHEQLLELDQANGDVLYNLALLLQKRGRPADAVRYYRRAVALRPDFPQALLNLGHALMALGKHDEAQAAWQTAVRANADLAETFLV